MRFSVGEEVVCVDNKWNQLVDIDGPTAQVDKVYIVLEVSVDGVRDGIMLEGDRNKYVDIHFAPLSELYSDEIAEVIKYRRPNWKTVKKLNEVFCL